MMDEEPSPSPLTPQADVITLDSSDDEVKTTVEGPAVAPKKRRRSPNSDAGSVSTSGLPPPAIKGRRGAAESSAPAGRAPEAAKGHVSDPARAIPSTAAPTGLQESRSTLDAAAVSKSNGGGGGGAWTDALRPYLRDPEAFARTGDVVHYTDDVVVVRDKYPKARVHWLVLPRTRNVADVHALDPANEADVALMRAIKQTIEDMERRIRAMFPDYRGAVRKGTHAMPSLKPLHVHMITDDMQGANLRTKAHFNAFTTPFLMRFSELFETFVEDRKAIPRTPEAKAKEYLKQQLRCHFCSQAVSNMPALKRHLQDQHPLPVSMR